MRDDRAFGCAPEMTLYLLSLANQRSGLFARYAAPCPFLKAHQSDKFG